MKLPIAPSANSRRSDTAYLIPVSMRIRVLNGIGPRGSTHKHNAQRYVDSGRAEWVSVDTIRFYPTDRRHAAATRNYKTLRYRYLAGDNGMSTLDNIRRIPVIHPEVLIRGVPTPA